MTEKLYLERLKKMIEERMGKIDLMYETIPDDLSTTSPEDMNRALEYYGISREFSALMEFYIFLNDSSEIDLEDLEESCRVRHSELVDILEEGLRSIKRK